jgi:hypothetical protein
VDRLACLNNQTTFADTLVTEALRLVNEREALNRGYLSHEGPKFNRGAMVGLKSRHNGVDQGCHRLTSRVNPGDWWAQ